MPTNNVVSDGASDDHKCGYIAVVGRPNVGKSTVVNAIVGQKVSIVTHKPQTTRHRILGIKNISDAQIMLVDTPGFHLDGAQAINRLMNKAALSALNDVDAIVFVVEAKQWRDEEQKLVERMHQINIPVIAAINKIDLLGNKDLLLPVIDNLNRQYEFSALVPISAKKHHGVDLLESEIIKLLPSGKAFYELDDVTDKSIRFQSAELIREQLYLALNQELPYAVTVEIEAFEEAENVNRVAAVIWVAKSSHKGIVIGKGGIGLKKVGQCARLAMEEAFQKKVHLDVWVKVKEGWNDDERALRNMGYQDM